MNKTTFHIRQMDCAAEEQMIRMKLKSDSSVRSLAFDIPERKLVVFHEGSPERLSEAIHEMSLGSTLIESVKASATEIPPGTVAEEGKLLRKVLLLNFGCFILELVTGLLSRSMGLVADSLDMLADAFVYGLALLAAGKSAGHKQNIARTAGYFQLVLAITGFMEVIRRFLGVDTAPAFGTMIIVSVIALAANAATLHLLQRSKSTEPHMKATMIFTSNDVVINLGVIFAGALVFWTGSNKPDLVIGTIVFFIVIRGAIRILKLAR